MASYTGQCLCGNVSYRVDGDPFMSGICHCKNCQRQAGSAFSTLWGVPKTAVTFSGEISCYEDSDTDTGNKVQRYFCGNCGSPIYSTVVSQPDNVFIKTGTLDDTSSYAPKFHIWCDSKQSWYDVPEGAPAMART